MPSINDYLRHGGLEFVQRPSEYAEDEHFVKGKHDDPDFVFFLPDSAPESLVKGIARNLVTKGEVYKKLRKMQLENPR